MFQSLDDVKVIQEYYRQENGEEPYPIEMFVNIHHSPDSSELVTNGKYRVPLRLNPPQPPTQRQPTPRIPKQVVTSRGH